MDKQPIKCTESPIDVISPRNYHEITVEILRKCTFTGSVEKVTKDYWSSYITVFNNLIANFEEVKNK